MKFTTLLLNAKITILHFTVLSLLFGCNNKTLPDLQPNIIIINIDDMGWRDLGFMGSQYYETPNIDALAKQGMIFTNGYASAANCAPSRACLLTGLWSTRHGIYTVGNSDRGKAQHRKLIPVKNTTILDTSHIIIPEVLKANSYQTCHAGKWHVSKDPLTRGFNFNFGGGSNGHPKSYNPPYKNVNLTPTQQNNYLTDVVMEKAVDFVKSAQQPFFLHYTPYAVHTPIHPVDSLLEKYQDKESWNGQANADYASMIDNLDRNIGWLIETLNKKQIFDNTLIIFTSDNGGLYGITQQKPLRAGKGSYYEGGIRVPFFFVWKNHIPENKTSNIPISNLDLFPTLLEALGLRTEFALDGHSIWSILQGKNRPWNAHFIGISLFTYRLITKATMKTETLYLEPVRVQ